ncbi:MAG: hypothetical protein KOO60_04710 [Gemmatimonadales bacterium]|nr:hypothetical protein [Gemmatimonadales bacterium]
MNKMQVLWVGSMLLLSSTGLAADDFDSRVVLEGGLVWPQGELSSDFDESSLGLGAEAGYEIGFRFRLPVTRIFSISPGFHFVDFKSHLFTHEDEQEYRTEALSYRFTLEGMLKYGNQERPIRPFLAVAAGLYRDRVVGFYDDPDAEERSNSVNTFGYSARLGLATKNFELSCVVHRNRVETWHFFPTESKEGYSWDNLGVRLGYLLPLK